MPQDKKEQIFFNQINDLSTHLKSNKYSQVFVLCDQNTHRDCLPKLRDIISIDDHRVIQITPGEEFKTLDTCEYIWSELLDKGADRHSVLLNLGGGVVGDIGGFCAATFMRGMAYIQIPTSLLAQVDASVGGKTGVDFRYYKNIIGAFAQPEAVYIEGQFLHTLPSREYKNGYVEILKHAMIADQGFLDDLITNGESAIEQVMPVVQKSVAIKQNIVEADPLEGGQRKVLNFGHTIGHALEHLALSREQDIRHGEAIAFGLLVALDLSKHKVNFQAVNLAQLEAVLLSYCSIIPDESDVSKLLTLARSDKKNKGTEIRFSLLEEIGKPLIDQVVSDDEIKDSIIRTIKTCRER